jgi:hypothetical protein
LDNFIRLDYQFDLDLLKKDVYNVVENVGWGEKNQICLTHPPGLPDWFHGTGPLMANKTFTELNRFLNGQYIESVYNTVKNAYPIGRVRIMLLPGQKCFSLHADITKRIHLPLETNEQCMMIIDNEVKYMPADGSAWLTNTTKPHTALNGNLMFDRIHLLFDLL